MSQSPNYSLCGPNLTNKHSVEHYIETVSIPRLVKPNNKSSVGSSKNLIVIKPENLNISQQKQFLKLGLLNIRSLTPKAVIVNEMVTDNNFDVLCLTETWLKPNEYFGLNESTPPGYCTINMSLV